MHAHETVEGEQPILHSHLASLEDGLEFINTLDMEKGQPVDQLATPRDALGWFYQHLLLHRDMLRRELRHLNESPEAAARTMRKIRRVRAAMRELIEASVEHRAADLNQLAEVNRALRTHYIYELVPAPDGISLDHRHEGDPIDGALARLTESVAREVSQGDADRLRICANDTCRWVFADTSRTGKRKWCDMATCGNRAKAARHRERKRAGIAADGGDQPQLSA
jgi:predicted RNA-binding Zn ribbon-like protein